MALGVLDGSNPGAGDYDPVGTKGVAGQASGSNIRGQMVDVAF